MPGLDHNPNLRIYPNAPNMIWGIWMPFVDLDFAQIILKTEIVKKSTAKTIVA